MAANGVKKRHKSYDAYAPQWKRVRDVVSGQDAVYSAGTEYLPMLAEEEFEDYQKRLKRTPFYNASWRTMASFVGLMFRKPPIKEVPAALEPLLEDVTMSGVSFDNFAQDVTLEDIEISRVGVLVDYPTPVANPDGSNNPLTQAQAEALGLRPSMVMYKAESIINWKFAFINNRFVLTQVRLWEMQTEEINEFESREYPVIRVLDLFFNQYRVRVFKEEDESQIGDDVFPKMDGLPLDYIPFYFIGPDGGQHEVTEPVLIDLVDLNIKHFQVSADYEHGCHFAGLPTAVVSGMPPEFDDNGNKVQPKLYIGGQTAWILPVGADAKYMELAGTGLPALEKNLDRKEAQMAAIGARMLTPEKAGVEAADTVAMRHSGENSILAAIAVAVSEGMTKALITFARWAGIKDANEKNIKYSINRDFMPFPITPQALTSLLAAVQAGRLSHEAFFDLLKRGDLHDAELDFETEQARIDTTNPVPEPVAVGPDGKPIKKPNAPGNDKDKPEGKE